MSDTLTGAAFVVLAIGGAYYLSKSTTKLNHVDVTALPQNKLSTRAGNASRSTIDPDTVLESEAPTFRGRREQGGGLMERVVSTRLAQSWRSAEMPIQAELRRSANLPLGTLLNRIQNGVQSVYSQTIAKTNYVLDSERERPVVQGRIRQKFQIPNFLEK